MATETRACPRRPREDDPGVCSGLPQIDRGFKHGMLSGDGAIARPVGLPATDPHGYVTVEVAGQLPYRDVRRDP